MFYVSLAALIAVTATPSAGQTTIPFTYVDNRIVVECKIDGQGPFTMILDTGSPSIAVTPETAAKLAIAVKHAASVTGAGNDAAKNGRAAIATLSLGRLTFNSLNADVLDLTEIRTACWQRYLRSAGILKHHDSGITKTAVTYTDAPGSREWPKRRPARASRLESGGSPGPHRRLSRKDGAA